ncbi:MAG TPA: L-seryl-tRNA(Sec) selenium transferase [Fimbriiglobus sp.]|jgi:L-seryl-tRNA(Ser) seleniumtransferase
MNPYRQLPAVSRVLKSPALAATRAVHPAAAVTRAIRAELDRLRSLIAAGECPNGATDPEAVAALSAGRVERESAQFFRPVINATGIILHTNLGRSPYPEIAVRAMADAARGYLNLELDLESGRRSSRQDNVRAGIRAVTGAESGTAVNNCAAATVLVLRALAAGKEVIVSRGQLIEIGGSFRIPEIMAASGAILKEVGTTNITRLDDYERAVGPNTALLMRVHTSNYRVTGFTESVGIEELAALGQKAGLPVVDDCGSGLAVDLGPFGLGGEPLVSEGIAAGAELVLFSGDKLLGGPQAGVIAGREDLIRKVEKDPFMRAVRLDKTGLAALEATLSLYRDPARAISEIPTLRMLTTPHSELTERAVRLADRLRNVAGLSTIEVLDDVSFVGGGSWPDRALATAVVAVTPVSQSASAFAVRLRTGTPAVVARIHDGRLLFDLRTVFADQEEALVSAVATAAK